MKAKRYTGKWRQLELFAAPEQPTPLPKGQCQYHGAKAVCDRCPERYETDGHGFPHSKYERTAGHPKGGAKHQHLLRVRLRVCPGCDEPKTWVEWDLHRGECLICTGGARREQAQ